MSDQEHCLSAEWPQIWPNWSNALEYLAEPERIEAVNDTKQGRERVKLALACRTES